MPAISRLEFDERGLGRIVENIKMPAICRLHHPFHVVGFVVYSLIIPAISRLNVFPRQPPSGCK